MYPYDLNSFPSFQASGAGYIHPSQSIHHGSRVHPSLPESTSEYFFPTVSQKLYPPLGQDGHSTQTPQIPVSKSARSFSHSVGSVSTRAPPSLSSHPYHQAKIRHRASAQRQEWRQPPFPTASTPSFTLDEISPFEAVAGTSTPTIYQDPSQLAPQTRKRGLSASSTFQSAAVSPDVNQNTPSFVGSLAVAEQTLAPSPVPVDQADIEYAQDRYGDKRCFYQCRFDLDGSPCNKWIVGDRTRVLRHLRNHHHLQTGPALPAGCRWDKCTHSQAMKQENLSRHVVTHLGVKWKCPHCNRLFSRDDAVHRHIERMVPGMEVTEAEVVPGREARALYES